MLKTMIYFAYGSLLDRERLSELCPGAKPLAAARVRHHTICFTGQSKGWGGGTATIIAATTKDLWGGLYEIDEGSRSALEASAAEDGYVWCVTEVESKDGARIHAALLVKVRELTPSQPSSDYMAALRAAWEQWGLSEPVIPEDCAPAAE